MLIIKKTPDKKKPKKKKDNDEDEKYAKYYDIGDCEEFPLFVSTSSPAGIEFFLKKFTHSDQENV
jgi:hypothetical protein